MILCFVCYSEEERGRRREALPRGQHAALHRALPQGADRLDERGGAAPGLFLCCLRALIFSSTLK